MRKLLFIAAVALIVWAAAVVPMPFATLEPVPALPVADVLDLDGPELEPLSEELLFTVVQVRQPSALGAIEVLLDETRDLTFVQAIIPPGIDEEQFIEFQERLFRESLRAAIAVGMQAADREVMISGDGARVMATLPGTPAAGVLQEEDVITAVDGEPISLASELATVLGDLDVGTEVELTVRRDGEEFTEALEISPLAEADEVGQPGIGVAVVTVDLQIDVPADVDLAPEAQRIGGPSAGLMIALSVFDAATEDDLARGRVIAGSGTIDLTGNVGPVSGISEKVRGALAVDADVFLVPEMLADEAREAAPDDLEVIAVDSLQAAIDALAR